MALADSLLHGCLRENQEGQCSLQTGPPAHKVQKMAACDALEEGAYGDSWRGVPLRDRLKGKE